MPLMKLYYALIITLSFGAAPPSEPSHIMARAEGYYSDSDDTLGQALGPLEVGSY